VREGCSFSRPFYRPVTSAFACPACDSRDNRAFLRIEERLSGPVLRKGGYCLGDSLAIRTSK
jgi:hypothetical protein